MRKTLLTLAVISALSTGSFAAPLELNGQGTQVLAKEDYILTGDYSLAGESVSMAKGSKIDLNGHKLSLTSNWNKDVVNASGVVNNVDIYGKGSVEISQKGTSNALGCGTTNIKADNIKISAQKSYAIWAEATSKIDLSSNNSSTGVINIIAESQSAIYQTGAATAINIHDFSELHVTTTSVSDDGHAISNNGGKLSISGGKVFLTSDRRSAFVNQEANANTTFNVKELYVEATIDNQDSDRKIGAFAVGAGSVTVNSENLSIKTINGENQTQTTHGIYLYGDNPSLTIATKQAFIDGNVTAKVGEGSIEADTLKINGNVDIKSQANMDLNFSGQNSHLKGKAFVEGEQNSLTFHDGATWNVVAESQVSNLVLDQGIVNLAATNDDLSVESMSGNGGTIVLDAVKTNTVAVSNTTEKTKIEVKASENADKVTTDQATTMVQRLEGVTNKTGHVDEGMYQGAITVDKTGHATQAKNDLMADTLELASASTLSLNRILMNDVRKRLGDIRSLEATNGVWARYDGGKLSGEGTTNKFNTLHIGGDMAPFDDNSMRLGISASYMKGDVDYTRGSSDLDAYSLAAYGTWMADNGLFADVIARVAKTKSDMKVDGVYKGDLNNTAYSLSGEMGWRFDFNDMFYAEPQMEATYTYIDSDKMTLSGNGEAYHYAVDSFDSLIGRVGVLAGMKCPAQKGDLYVRASMVHEFLGDATINGGNMAKIENDGKDTWVEYGVGANFNIKKNAYIWADIERTAGANVDEDWRGTVGVRYAF